MIVRFRTIKINVVCPYSLALQTYFKGKHIDNCFMKFPQEDMHSPSFVKLHDFISSIDVLSACVLLTILSVSACRVAAISLF